MLNISVIYSLCSNCSFHSSWLLCYNGRLSWNRWTFVWKL